MKIKGLPVFSAGKVAVVGDLMLDRYMHGDTSRISPEAPVPVVRVEETEDRAGGAGNVALNLAALGGGVELFGLTGEDDTAVLLEKILTDAHINCHFQPLKDVPTITKLRVLSRHQQLLRLDFESPFSEESASLLPPLLQSHLANVGALILSDYAKGSLHASQQLIEMANKAGIPIIVDPKGSDFSRYQGATLITPNMHEFETVVGHCANEAVLVERGEALRDELQLNALLITRSEKGMTLLEKGKDPLHIPTRAQEVYDVTGAGDTVVAMLAASLAAGESLAESTHLANLAAGVVVGKLGTATVSVPELRRALREEDVMERGCVNEEQLLQLIQEAKAHGESVVMTNGCFDILHTGHVTYLEEAARLGDRLIVAVNDDASVSRIKGPERPVNTQAHRMHVLAALDCVDWVVGFYEDTPTRLICAMRPDILVKGGDNNPDEIPGGECVRASGGEVKVMSYLQNVSTTGIIGTIRASEHLSRDE